MYRPQQPVIDADGHIYENDREILHYLPEPWRDTELMLATPFFPTLDGFHRQSRRVMDGRAPQLDFAPAESWIQFLDETNIAATVLFPTAGLGYGLIPDPDWAAALAYGYNDWLADRWLKAAPERIKGMALIPMQDPARAVTELHRAVTELGMVGGILPAAGIREAFGHEMFWPVYEAAQELNVVLAVHGAPSYGLGLERLHRLIEVRTLTHGFSQMLQMTSLLFEGVFDTFPRLRFAFCEAGCGWVSYLAERLDLEYGNRPKQAPRLTMAPSERLRSGQIFFHTELNERALGRGIEEFGDVFFCASDYPHEPRHEFPEAMEQFLERDDIPEPSKRKLLWDTPLRMYQLDPVRLATPLPAMAGRA
ncbi:MAG: uncharacterized protein QOF51_1357 [Chloroflexota bacterium]|nr:uncharacterized protein [Chloroflexota bacterium]